jgi:hypothetical protein
MHAAARQAQSHPGDLRGATLSAVRSRSRVLAAVVIALAVHVSAREIVDAAQLRVRPVVRSDSTGERLVVDVAHPASARAPAVAPLESAPVRKARVTPPPAPPLPAPEIIVETVRDVVESPAPAPVEPMLPRAPAPRSFLERVIAGSSGLPPPNVDDMFRAPHESDAASAERKIQAFARAAAAHGAPPGPDAGSIIEQLERLDDGTYRYETGGFVATIQVDGAVLFINKDNAAGLGASGLGRDVYAPYGPSINPIARIDGAQPVREYGIPLGTPSTTLGSGSFDPTAALLRAQGQEPYEHEKMCFLDDTRDLRAELRVAHEKAQMAGLRRSLERAWFDDARPAVERRAALFAIWDECREEEVGLLARELVESFVRQHLPKDSPDAFSVDELAALYATRTSRSEFSPYG